MQGTGFGPVAAPAGKELATLAGGCFWCTEAIFEELQGVEKVEPGYSGGATANRKIKGTVHWVSAAHAFDAEVRLYDRLFKVPEPDAKGDFKSFINPNSLEVVNAKLEPSLKNAEPNERYQFERLGYFSLDADSTTQKQIWNRTITLRDTWTKLEVRPPLKVG